MNLYNIVVKLVAGLQKILPASTKLTLGGTSYTSASLVAVFTNWVALYQAAESSKQQQQVAVQQLHAATPGIRSLIAALGSYLRGTLGSGNPQLAQLGLKTGARSQSSALTKAQSVASALLTKQARHILGSQQRLDSAAPVKATVQLLGPDGNPIQTPGSVTPPATGSGAAGTGNNPSGK